MRRHRSRFALVACLVAGLLAGCAAIPTSGPVQTPGPVARQGNAGIVLQPYPPQDGASPADIVSGFVQAANADGSYAVARKFLTSQFAASWTPNTLIFVHEQAWAVTQPDATRVRLRVPTTARVQDGTYTPSGQTQDLSYDLVQVRGQWRIAHGPDAVVLSETAFQRSFVAKAVQFYDPAFKRFVPELRWFANRAGAAAIDESIIRASLAAPTGALAGGVAVSAFPRGTALVGRVATGDDFTAFALTVPGAQLDRRTTDRMQQQVASTLGVSPSTLRLTVNGATVPTAPQAEVDQVLSSAAVVLADGRFGTLGEGGVTEDRVFGPRIAALRPSAVTISARQQLAAVLTDRGQVAILRRQGDARVVDRRPRLIAPTVDQSGWTYSVPQDQPTQLRATPASGAPVTMQADLGGSVISIEASADGTRLLVLVETDTGPSAYVYGIERDAQGAPTGLTTGRYPVAFTAERALDATWVDPTTVAVLTSGRDVQDVVSQQLGGLSSRLGRPVTADTVVGAGIAEYLRARLQSGDVVRQQTDANLWTSEFARPVEVEVLAVQR